MPEMHIHRSGGIVFSPTKEEQEIRNLKDELRKEITEVQKLKEEILSMMPK
jgi:hypothetical protein